MLSNCRVSFGSVISVAVKRMAGLGPNTDSRTVTTTPALIAACDGYSGCIGVAFNGVQLGSRSVASLPVTAIRNGDMDGNDATERDPSWTPLNATPMHPEYPSQAAISADRKSVV